MAGSHRAEKPSKRAGTSAAPARGGGARRLSQRVSRRAVAIAAVLAVLPALWLGITKVSGNDDQDPKVRHTELPIPPVTTPAPSPSGTPTPSAPTSTPAAPTTVRTPANLPRVPQDVPRRLLSPGLLDVGFDDSVEPRGGSFEAASTAEVARWGSRGRPGSPATDTVYVIGKSFTRGVSAFDTLPRIRASARVVIRTDNGDLTYTVDTVVTRSAAGLARDAAFRAKAPGRLVLVGLLYNRSGDLTGRAVVVTATMTGATRR